MNVDTRLLAHWQVQRAARLTLHQLPDLQAASEPLREVMVQLQVAAATGRSSGLSVATTQLRAAIAAAQAANLTPLLLDDR
jgi:hypothetical protein